jgi:bifunctional UDP-N-acetylglucosamine pyrophosphorylase/glucosamine-1-phosphate N-acetyltransferase
MTAGTLRGLIDHHRRSNVATTRLTGEASPSGADGAYCFRIESLLQTLSRLSDRKEPILLSRILEAQRTNGERVELLAHPDEDELRTIAGFRDLADATRAFRAKKNRDLMDSGVTLIDPDNTYVDLEVLVEKGAVLHPLVTLEGNCQIGAGSEIRSGTRISDSRIAPGVLVLDGCVIVESEVEAGTTVGPFAHLRSQVMVAENCRVGNFVELKKTRMGKGSKAAHLAYLGDATLGEGVNVGAGTITCNYDGTHKHPTIIEDGVFVGTDSQLVAPVRIGRGSYVAAGSCITQDVPPESLAIARSRQTNKTDWKRSSKERKND